MPCRDHPDLLAQRAVALADSVKRRGERQKVRRVVKAYQAGDRNAEAVLRRYVFGGEAIVHAAVSLGYAIPRSLPDEKKMS